MSMYVQRFIGLYQSNVIFQYNMHLHNYEQAQNYYRVLSLVAGFRRLSFAFSYICTVYHSTYLFNSDNELKLFGA